MVLTWSVEDGLTVLVKVHSLLHKVGRLRGWLLLLIGLWHSTLLLLLPTMLRVHRHVEHATHSDRRGQGVEAVVQNRRRVIAEQGVVVAAAAGALLLLVVGPAGGVALGLEGLGLIGAVEGQQGIRGLHGGEDGPGGGGVVVLGEQRGRCLGTGQGLG